MPRGGRPRTKELYNQVLAAFRTVGVNFGKVGRMCGIDRETAARIYRRGWADREGCLPVKGQLEMDRMVVMAARAKADPEELVAVAQQVLATSLESAREDAKDAAQVLALAAQRAQELEERAKGVLDEAQKKLAEVEELARARIEDADKAARASMASAEIEAKQRLADLLARAKVDAAETMADEANAAKFGRKAALGAAAIAALILRDAQQIAAQLRVAMGDLSKLTPGKAMRVAREMVKLVESAEKALILSFQAERLRVGQPTEVVGFQSMDSSIEEREIKARAVLRALEKAKARGLTVVDGGNAVATGSNGANGAAAG